MKPKVKELVFGKIEPAATTATSSLQPRQVFRSDKRWGRSVTEWPSLDAFLATAEVQSGIHSVPIGEFAGKQLNYDFLLTVRPGTVLLCHIHGNTPREGIDLPIITGLGVTSSITASMFVPSDPVLALDPSLGLAWHFGCDGIPLQAITVSIVMKLQAVMHAPRVVVWGGSGGGFAAIRVARDIPNSIALAWNPQTDIAKYVQDPVNSYRRLAFPAIAAGGAFPSNGEQFPSLCTEEFVDGYKGRIVYLQESTDWHVEAHLTPFLASFCKKALSEITESQNFSGFVTDQLYLHLGRWGNGHVPPSKDVISTVLGLLSDVTANGGIGENLTGIPGEAVRYIASTLSHPVPATKLGGQPSSDPLSSSSTEAPLLDYKEILAIRLGRIADDFSPFDAATVNCIGDSVVLPLFTGEVMEVSRSHGVQWSRTFVTQANSSIMHLFSLAPIGKLLATFQKRNDVGALEIAVIALTNFLDYSSEPDHRMSIEKIPSADHSAATRVRVLIKFIQVMGARHDDHYALLTRVCDSLKYWSDWLSAPQNYKQNNHGLMGSIALLHSSIQFGVTPHSSAYLQTATNRIIELGKSSFDCDGLCNENSIGYHNFNLHCYRRLLDFCRHYGLSDTLVRFLEDLIHRATRALEFCVWQDGSIPPIGDSAVYPTKTASRNTPRCFYESGFAVVKDADLYFSILCGSRSEIHKQVDDSSMTLRLRNCDVLIDGGAYLYDRADPYRRCVESSFGHSGLFLKEFDGLLRSEFLKKYGPLSGKIEQFEENEEGVRIKCRYSIRGGRAVFTRHIFICWPDEIAIVDSVELHDDAFCPETVQRFLFGPTLDVQFDGSDKLILASDEFSCSLFQLLDCEGILYRGENVGVFRGWYSHKYKEVLPTYGVDFICDLPVSRFSTIIKLAKCASPSECSMAIREFAGLVGLRKESQRLGRQTGG